MRGFFFALYIFVLLFLIIGILLNSKMEWCRLQKNFWVVIMTKNHVWSRSCVIKIMFYCIQTRNNFYCNYLDTVISTDLLDKCSKNIDFYKFDILVVSSMNMNCFWFNTRFIETNQHFYSFLCISNHIKLLLFMVSMKTSA